MKGKRAALMGLLTAAAFALSYAEHLLPLPLPVPGIKLGLANLVTLFALYTLGARHAAMIVTARCLLAAVLFGGPVQLLLSLSGGMLAVLAMALLRPSRRVTAYGVSVAGAAAHSLGQVLAAMTLMSAPGLAAYLLLLWPVSIVTGTLVALAYGWGAPLLKKAFGYIG